MKKERVYKILQDRSIDDDSIDKIWDSLSKYEDIYVKKVFFHILNDMEENDISVVLEKLDNKKYYWGDTVYSKIKGVIDEQDNFLINPFEVEEGVLECNKCGSKRVFSYSKQVRSSDEGTSVFATCVACKSSWIHSG